MTCKVKYNDGRSKEHDSIREATTALINEYPNGVIYDASAFPHEPTDEDSSYDVRSGRVALVWDSEEDSNNDDGSHAVAEIVCDAE